MLRHAELRAGRSRTATLFCLALAAPALAQTEPAPARRPLFAPLRHGVELTLPNVDPAIPSPAEFLGYSLGERFTPHDRQLAYLSALAAAAPDRVRQFDYGSTYEGRPLRLLVITSPARHARSEETRAALARWGDGRGAEGDAAAGSLPVVVWLAYGVHGNEASSAETAMAVAWALAAARGAWTETLDDLVVIVDPLVNPDGRERYVQFFASRSGAASDPEPDAAEHSEPWPGGRFNHYLFDLNRDFTWATQQETQARLAALRAWEPQVYVDFHEMGRASSYFFPPPADPVHPAVDARILAAFETFGRGNAAAFDRLGWPYFVRQTYDLLYPGYGDAYPSLRGAVGMTYEVAGGGRAGLRVRLADGSTLTLADRAAQHFVASLATLETARRERRALLAAWAGARQHVTQSAPRATYFWRADQPEGRALAALLLAHGVRVQRLTQSTELEVRSPRGGESARRDLPAGTFAVSVRQPTGNLVRALFEREAALPPAFVRDQRQRLEEGRDADFYDITAWSLPLAWNLEAWVGDDAPARLEGVTSADLGTGTAAPPDGGVGFLIPPQGLSGYRAGVAALRQGLAVRAATADFVLDGREFASGTLFLPRLGNPPDLGARLRGLAAAEGVEVRGAASGLAARGPSLGSSEFVALRPARVALARGRGIGATSFGALWHLLDRQVGLAPSVFEIRTLGELDLDRFDVVVLPDGGDLDGAVGERARALLDAWIRRGGVLVTIGGTTMWARRHGLIDLKAWQPPERDDEDEHAPAPTVAEWIADQPLDTPGAILATSLRGGSVLASGLRSAPPVLFAGSDILLPTGDPRVDVLVAAQDPVLAGFAWPEARQRLAGALLLARQERGEGRVVAFAQDPAFRGFWRGTMPLLLNALLLEPALSER